MSGGESHRQKSAKFSRTLFCIPVLSGSLGVINSISLLELCLSMFSTPNKTMSLEGWAD
jgi:hypothetical protein